MKLSIRVSGDEELRRKMANVADCSVSGTLTRRGLTQVGQIVTRVQKRMAPVRKGRLQMRKMKGRIGRGMEIGKAIRLSKVPVQRVRKMPADFIGPGRQIKPGLIKRSIGYRVSRVQGSFVVKMGMNVGKRRSNNNFAPHSAIVGVGTKQRFSFNPRPGEVGPNKINRGVMPQNRFIADATAVAAQSAIAALDKAVKEDTVRAYNLSLRSTRNFAGANG